MPLVRITKVALVAAIALWGALGAWGNLEEYVTGNPAGVETVRSVLALKGTPLEGKGSWREITSTPLVHLAYAYIWGSKLACAILCGIAAVRMWRSRGDSADLFHKAKELAFVGAGIAILMLFTGFITIAGTYFLMWQSKLGQFAHSFAFMYAACIALVAILVSLKDEEIDGIR